MKRSIIFFSFLIIAAVVFTGCSKEYSVENGVYTMAAKGTLKNDSGSCMPITISGTFYDGILPSSDTNTIKIQVNVISTGSYSIKTDLQNGFQFADSGYFQNTGLNTVSLKPTGTPILQTPTTFTVSFDSTECTFVVDVKDSTGIGGNTGGGGTTTTPSDTAWHFTSGNNYFHGSVQTAVVESIGGYNALGIAGYTVTGDSVLSLEFILPNSSIVTGNYFTIGTPNSTAVFGFALVSTGNSIYDAINNAPIPCSMTLTIDSYNSTTKVVSGSFSGTAEDPSANISVPITAGHYTATIN